MKRSKKKSGYSAKKPAAAVEATAKSGGSTMVKRIETLNRWRESFNPLERLTLRRAVQLARDYFLGIMADVQWTYFYIEQTDPDLFALIERRSSRLLEMDYSIKISKDADKVAGAAQQKYLQEKFDQIDNLSEAIEHLATASFRGYAHCEKFFENGELTHLEIVDQWNAVRDGLRGDWKYNPEARTAMFESLPAEALMPPENFLYREVRRPINRIALFKFIRGNLSEKDWDAFIEIYGIPGGVVVGPPNVPPDKAAEYEAAAQTIAEGGSGFLPNGSTWTPNTGPRGLSPFRERLEYLSEKLVLAGTGGMLTMLTRSGSGTLAGNAHSDAFEQIAKAEAVKISAVINNDLTDAWLDEKFPGQPHLAYFALSANEETKIGEVVDHVTKLAAAGYQVAADEVSERTGYTVAISAPKGAAGGGGLDGSGSDPITGDPASIQNRRIKNRTAAKDAIFKASAAAAQMAAKQPVFKPIADRLATMLSVVDNPAALRAVAEKLRADSGQLYRDIIAKTPELAQPAEDAIGTALVSGFAESAEAKKP